MTKAEQKVTIKDLLESGAHFGHQKHRWNPKMKRFIFEERNGIYIIDLAKTMQQIRTANEVIEDVVAKHGSILFVGTKKQAKSVVRECAEECGEFYVSERWLGGMLTNLSTIRQSVKTLERIEKKIASGGEGLTKKEMVLLSKQQEKLNRNLSGIRGMRKIPGLVVVVDPSKEHIAVAEANKLGIPVMGLVDTNCDPDPIDYVIACNDDALKSIKLILQSLMKTVIQQKQKMNIAVTKEEKEKALEAKKRKEKAEKSEEEERRVTMTAKISADMVKKLRERTGVGMSKCKAALDEAGGDLDKAIEILRKAGAASAVKKSARETNEGLVSFKEGSNAIAYVEVNAETDFVVKNEKFTNFVEFITEAVLSNKPSSLENLMGLKASDGRTFEETRVELVQTIGENIQVRRFVVFDKAADCSYGLYRHLGGKIACFAEIKGSSSAQDLAKDIAMHVAADAPEYLKAEDIPAEIIEKEKEIASSQIKNKPPEIIEKILVGKIKAFSDQVCLLGQKFIKDTSVTIEQHVQAVGKQMGANLEVAKFLRWEVGQD